MRGGAATARSRAGRLPRRPLAVSAAWVVVLEKQDGGDYRRGGGRGGHGAARPAGADAGEQRRAEPHQGAAGRLPGLAASPGRETPARGGHAAVGAWPELVSPVWRAQARGLPSFAARAAGTLVSAQVLSRPETDL